MKKNVFDALRTVSNFGVRVTVYVWWFAIRKTKFKTLIKCLYDEMVMVVTTEKDERSGSFC